MPIRRTGIVAVVILLAAAAVYGAYQLICTGSACRGDGTAAGRQTVTATPGAAAKTPAAQIPIAIVPSRPPGSSTPSPATQRADRLLPGQRLNRGEMMISPDGRFTMRLQASDGNLVIYETGTTTIWSLGPNPNADYLINQRDGNLVLIGRDGKPIWSSGTQGELTLYLFDDGNLVLLDPKNRKVWETDSSVEK